MLEILDIEEASKFLKIAKPTIYRHLRSGDIPAFKIGRVWRFEKKSLEDWVRLRVKEETDTRISYNQQVNQSLNKLAPSPYSKNS